MPLTLPTGSTIEPAQDDYFCRMYEMKGSTPWKEGSSIVVPDQSVEETFFCRITKAGPGRLHILPKPDEVTGEAVPAFSPMLFSEGEDVMFTRYLGERIQIGDSLYILLKQDDIIASITLPEEKRDAYFQWAGIGGPTDVALSASRVIQGATPS